MKRIILAILLLATPFAVDAQRRDKAAADRDTQQWKYEIERVDVRGVGVVGDGNVVAVKSWCYSKNPSVAKAQSFKNAVHGVIFKGIPVVDRVPGLKPLCSDASAEMKNAEYFRAFFADGGLYMRFANSSSKGSNTSVLKVDKRTYKVGVNVIVDVAALRKELERAGVINKLGGRF